MYRNRKIKKYSVGGTLLDVATGNISEGLTGHSLSEFVGDGRKSEFSKFQSVLHKGLPNAVGMYTGQSVIPNPTDTSQGVGVPMSGTDGGWLGNVGGAGMGEGFIREGKIGPWQSPWKGVQSYMNPIGHPDNDYWNATGNLGSDPGYVWNEQTGQYDHWSGRTGGHVPEQHVRGLQYQNRGHIRYQEDGPVPFTMDNYQSNYNTFTYNPSDYVLGATGDITTDETTTIPSFWNEYYTNPDSKAHERLGNEHFSGTYFGSPRNEDESTDTAATRANATQNTSVSYTPEGYAEYNAYFKNVNSYYTNFAKENNISNSEAIEDLYNNDERFAGDYDNFMDNYYTGEQMGSSTQTLPHMGPHQYKPNPTWPKNDLFGPLPEGENVANIVINPQQVETYATEHGISIEEAEKQILMHEYPHAFGATTGGEDQLYNTQSGGKGYWDRLGQSTRDYLRSPKKDDPNFNQKIIDDMFPNQNYALTEQEQQWLRSNMYGKYSVASGRNPWGEGQEFATEEDYIADFESWGGKGYWNDPEEIKADMDAVRLDMYEKTGFDFRYNDTTEEVWEEYMKMYEGVPEDQLPLSLRRTRGRYGPSGFSTVSTDVAMETGDETGGAIMSKEGGFINNNKNKIMRGLR